MERGFCWFRWRGFVIRALKFVEIRGNPFPRPEIRSQFVPNPGVETPGY